MSGNRVACLRCHHDFDWDPDHPMVCPTCVAGADAWTADDDAQLAAEANTSQMAFAILAFRVRHLGRLMAKEWRAGWARGRAKGQARSKQPKRRQA